MTRYPVTPRGLELMRDDLEVKARQLRHTSVEIEEARALGDLSENFEYHAAKDRQGLLAAQVRDLKDRIARAEVIDPSRLEGERVVFGATVVIMHLDDDSEQTFQIVGEPESDAPRGRISVASPLARSLIGKEVGDQASVPSRAGARQVEIVDVRFA